MCTLKKAPDSESIYIKESFVWPFGKEKVINSLQCRKKHLFLQSQTREEKIITQIH